jgi:hypothetical protein
MMLLPAFGGQELASAPATNGIGSGGVLEDRKNRASFFPDDSMVRLATVYVNNLVRLAALAAVAQEGVAVPRK